MPYPSTIPRIYDDCKTISISDLNKWEYLIQGNYKNSTVQWSRDGTPTASINVRVDYMSELPAMALHYSYDGESIHYTVHFTSVPSNLGRGSTLYFVCPFTGLRCRKLYLAAGRFAHRTYRHGYYESQILSSRDRMLVQIHKQIQKQEDAYNTIYAKGFTKLYNGTTTRRFRQLSAILSKQPKMSLMELFMS